MYRYFLLLFIVGLYSTVGYCQSFFHQGKFGKNRVQYKKFDWQYVSTNNFEVHYYQGGQQLAQLAARYAEEDFTRITDLVGFSPYNKIKLFIYQSITDLQQSNIGVSHQSFSSGSQTRFVRSEVEIPFTGNLSEFKKEIAYGIADILIFEMMYGGNLKEVLSSTYLLRLPEWFMAGAAKYIAEGWSVEMDDHLRDMLTEKNFPKPNRIRGEEAAIVGQSIWNYIAEEYGKTNISSILNLTRIVRNEKSSIQGTLGISYQTFIQQWKNYYLQQLSTVANQHNVIDKRLKLFPNKKNIEYHQISIHPSGKWIAFTENDQGKVKVKIASLEKNKQKTVFSAGYRLLNQRVEKQLPLVAWKNDHELIIIGTKAGKIQLFVREPFTTRWQFWKHNPKIRLDNLTHVKDFDIHPDENTLVMSAEKNGQNDLYLLQLDAATIQQLTKDLNDDLCPKFMPDGKSVIFSSNRKTDSLQTSKPEDNLSPYFNIFTIPFAKGAKKQLQRLTNNIHNDFHPMPLENNDILYLSDQKGIYQLFRLSLKDSITSQLTNYAVSIQQYDYRNHQFVFSMLRHRKNYLFKDTLSLQRNVFTGKTARQQKIDLRTVREMKKQKSEDNSDTLVKDTVSIAQEELAADEIDTDNYTFDAYAKGKRKSFLERFKSKVKDPTTKEFKISSPRPYEQRFSADNFSTSLYIDPLRGSGILFEVGMTESLENHKIDAGLFFQRNLNNSNFYAEYHFLKHRVDLGAKFERNNLQTEDEITNGILARNSLDYVQVSVSYPFSIASRFAVAPFFATTKFTDLDIFNSLPEQVKEYGGFNAEFVFDNSVITSLN
ncbi:MAG: hypothetical protein NZ521_00960, partial [Flammeovirgaceae bacterium]|nr:hypothetical protein [Flammeovirgaceae bacterium]MDW8286666.1 hypothetical protein [Flammeovirgaceae bacterium]